MESYGSVLLEDSHSYGDFKSKLNELNSKLNSNGIKCCSNFSIPPIFAGGTKFSFSSLLYGTKIEDTHQLNLLFNGLTQFESYQSIFSFTKKQGYKNYLLQGMMGDFIGKVDFKQLQRIFRYDVLLQDKILEYKGKLLSFMKMRKCPPDQYTLNKGLDIAKKSSEPYTLFYCTLNSHFDFHSPIKMVNNWASLNNESYSFNTTNELNVSNKEKYKCAINYTVDAIFDTIYSRITEDDIYIIYGDHQPTTLTDEKYGPETPFHIISKNKLFLSLWEEYGFNEGLVPLNKNKAIRMEAFYSALMITLNKVFGSSKEESFPFLEEGAKLIPDN